MGKQLYIDEEYKKFCKEFRLNDEYLESVGQTTRKESPMFIEGSKGIAYMRDDAVDDILDYTHKLEYDFMDATNQLTDKIVENQRLAIEVEELRRKINNMRTQLFLTGKQQPLSK